MKAKYDIQRLHNDCLAWCQNPVWKPWQKKYALQKCDGYLRIEDEALNRLGILYLNLNNDNYGQTHQFAHLIGLNVESYRIKETYKSAVERYLSTIGEGQPLWEGSPFYRKGIHAQMRGDLFVTTINHGNAWEDTCLKWKESYYFLRLDLNPDYQVEG